MPKQADLKRIQADLEEAHAEIETASKADGSLGDSLAFGFRSLLAAVGQLFAGLNDHAEKINEHDRQLKIAQHQVTELQRKLHGVKVSRGKAVAANKRAIAAIHNAKNVLDGMSLH